MIVNHNTPDGNIITVEESEPYKAKIFFTKVSNGVLGTTRLIGNLNKITKELIVFRNRAKHLHHRTDSYGFNYYLLEMSKHIEKIRIFEEYGGANNEYLIKTETIKQNAQVLDFIGEKQYFYSVHLLETFNKI